MASIQNIAAVCLATNYPTLASVPHSLINAYKDNVLALGIMLEDYTFPQVCPSLRSMPMNVCRNEMSRKIGADVNSKEQVKPCSSEDNGIPSGHSNSTAATPAHFFVISLQSKFDAHDSTADSQRTYSTIYQLCLRTLFVLLASVLRVLCRQRKRNPERRTSFHGCLAAPKYSVLSRGQNYASSLQVRK